VFRLNDEGRVSGKALLRMVETPIGDPNPNAIALEILKDLADQLGVFQDYEFTDEKDFDKRIEAMATQIKLQAGLNERKRFFCIVKAKKTEAQTTSLRNVLSKIRIQIPEIVFFELHRGQTKAAEEVILKIVKDRLESEKQT
jgi:hypothetical protein